MLENRKFKESPSLMGRHIFHSEGQVFWSRTQSQFTKGRGAPTCRYSWDNKKKHCMGQPFRPMPPISNPVSPCYILCCMAPTIACNIVVFTSWQNCSWLRVLLDRGLLALEVKRHWSESNATLVPCCYTLPNVALLHIENRHSSVFLFSGIANPPPPPTSG